MVGALWTGISGLSGAQRALDNESNNIANVNTLGYKASRIAFSDQMYQDNIGKGVDTFEVEKLYIQGNLKVTAVGYDLALSGDGFFQVSDGNDFFYTRAGNFRMGENGELQNAGGFSVQGWAMQPIDITDKDQFKSTDANATRFTNDYNKLLGNTVIRDATSISTIVAKSTDYTETARTDHAMFSGANFKPASTKISDVEMLITEYNKQLQLYANADPKPTASDSSVQKDMIDYDTDTAALATGDELYIYIDGVKYSQTFDTDELTTLKKLADKLSKVAGFKVYLTDGASPNTGAAGNDPLNNDPKINVAGTDGKLVIESLIPGKQFRITEYGWTDASNSNTATKGTVQSLMVAKTGTGMGAIRAVEEKLAEAVSGKQMDVYAANVMGAGTSYTLKKDSFGLGEPAADITVPNGGATAQTMADAINAYAAAGGPTSTELGYYVEAVVIDGNLVVTPKNRYYDKEINSVYNGDTDTATAGVQLGVVAKDAQMSGTEGAGGEFMSMFTTINQAARKDNIQLRLDSLKLTDSAFGDVRVDKSGLILMKQDGADFAVGQVAVAKFTDNRGLEPTGNNLLKSTNRSGQAIFNVDNDKTAEIRGGTLELSSSDLSESLVNLMVFQRAFEANSKSITTADTILTTLIQLKR